VRLLDRFDRGVAKPLRRLGEILAKPDPALGFFYSLTAPLKDFAQSWWVSGGLSALPDEPAQTTDAPEKPNRSKPQKRNERKLRISLSSKLALPRSRPAELQLGRIDAFRSCLSRASTVIGTK
jgi:hypothetical protein